MTAALYAFAAMLAASLATRTWLHDRDHPARRVFMALGWTLAVAWLSFALSMLPGLAPLRLLYVATGPLAPALGLWCVDLLLGASGRWPARLPWAAGALGLGMAVAQAALPINHPAAGLPEVIAGLAAWAMMALGLVRLRQARAVARLEAERRRLAWLSWSAGATMVFLVAETAVRTLFPVGPDDQMAFFDRGLLLQGALPPLSAMSGALTVYVLQHYLEARRLVALQEILARLAVTGVSALILLIAHTLTLRFVELARFPLHSSYLLFLATGLFLSVWATAHRPLHRLINRLFLGPSQDLADAAEVLLMELPGMTTPAAVAAAVADRLHAAGRFRALSVYLFDPALDAYRREAGRGLFERAPLEAVAAVPLVPALTAGPLSLADAADGSVAEALDAMAADLVWPLAAGDAVAGWICAQDAEWSDGLAEGERAEMATLVQAASKVLANLARFRKMEEDHRLAAMGTMSAGLAHEIRNPLAGLKGAAQVLQGEALPAGTQEMLGVIVDEVGRLDRVVTRFLDLARPIALQRRPVALDAVVRHALTLVRAGGVPDGVRLEEALDPTLPPVSLDSERMVQVLLNLVRNATQAVAGGGTVIVRTRRRTDPAGRAEVELAVLDDGPGLSPEAARHLFTPFHTTRSDGTGLGLAISLRLVQAHGGALDVHSQPDAGTTVTIRLPLPPS
jgi:nitrogen-specific signal transduction histidine kinase